MSASVKWAGLDELRAQLRRMPEHVAAEALPIVTAAPTEAMKEIIAEYPERAGALRKGLSVQIRDNGVHGARAVLKNRAKHAHIFELGSQARHNALGANRGSMPAGNVFIPKVIQHRRRMYEALAELLRVQGFQVSGKP